VLPQLIPGIRTFHLGCLKSFQESELSSLVSSTHFRIRIFHLNLSKSFLRPGLTCAIRTHFRNQNFAPWLFQLLSGSRTLPSTTIISGTRNLHRRLSLLEIGFNLCFSTLHQNVPPVLPKLISGTRTFHLCFFNLFQEPGLLTLAS
jgi:hypothetical protein